jgi:hypothetical protein
VQCGPPDTSCAVIFPFAIPEVVVADIAAAAAVEACIGDKQLRSKGGWVVLVDVGSY